MTAAEAGAAGRAQARPARAVVRLAGIAGVTVYYLLRQAWALAGVSEGKLRRERTNWWVGQWARRVARLAGVRVRSQGPLPSPGVLVTPNHQSYLDILAMAALIPVTFVSKAEVASWPVAGFLLRRTDQLLVSRNRAKDLVASIEGVADRLRGGHSVCVFLEGTTSGGDRVLRFHSSLLEPVIQAELEVVPAAIRWSGSGPGIVVEEDIAYWKDHHLPRHLWRLLGLKGCEAEVWFGSAISAAGQERGALAEALRDRVVALKSALDSVDPVDGKVEVG